MGEKHIVYGWKVSGWNMYGWKVCGWKICGWKVCGWKVYGWKTECKKYTGEESLGEKSVGEKCVGEKPVGQKHNVIVTQLSLSSSLRFLFLGMSPHCPPSVVAHRSLWAATPHGLDVPDCGLEECWTGRWTCSSPRRSPLSALKHVVETSSGHSCHRCEFLGSMPWWRNCSPCPWPGEPVPHRLGVSMPTLIQLPSTSGLPIAGHCSCHTWQPPWSLFPLSSDCSWTLVGSETSGWSRPAGNCSLALWLGVRTNCEGPSRLPPESYCPLEQCGSCWGATSVDWHYLVP